MDTKFLEKRGVDMDMAMKRSVKRGIDMDMVTLNLRNVAWTWTLERTIDLVPEGPFFLLNTMAQI